ncbi:hypothetical protein [Kyrpidia tusciae]|uniref:Uncharacterized protein n=1 Tax=Kyrpidia tusciae (strain DSM 2912 / NBRC 15312 / T2) TaxID=562970 RepID=D5WTL5_KYRT2|nr:hypothetical protein [Kyrpidia tusciae]ADG07251.1 hypothetical protein Btus_2594 [Kyrpidia tusciae DSM 2912]
MGISATASVLGAFGLLVLLALAVKVAALVFQRRGALSLHTGKVTAMTAGLMCAMTSGSILTGIFQSDPLWATVVSTIAGATVGVLIGIPLHLSICLEGFAAGVMGGGMGSMPMVSAPYVLSGFWWTLSLAAFLALHRLVAAREAESAPRAAQETGWPDGTAGILLRRMTATALVATVLVALFTLLLPLFHTTYPPLIQTPMCGS